MIDNNFLKCISIGFFICITASAAGWLQSSNLDPIITFEMYLIFSVILTALNTALALYFSIKGRQRLFYLVLFSTTLAFSLSWFAFSFALPLFLSGKVNFATKILIGNFFLLLCFFSIRRARKYKDYSDSEFQRTAIENIDKNKKTLDWQKLKNKFKIESSLYCPVFLKPIEPVLNAALGISILLGFSINSVYPMLSMVLIAVPAAFAASYFLQLITLVICQAIMIKRLEMSQGFRVQPKNLDIW